MRPLHLIITSLLGVAYGFVAYDCGALNANITTISLLEVKQCHIEARKPVITETYVRLLQLSRFRSVHVKLCRISMDRTIYYCGQGSHNSLVHNGMAEYLIEISSELCYDMHMHQKYRYNDYLFTGLRANTTISKPAIIAGSVQSDGTCEGAKFDDNYGSWAGVVVQAKFRITLQDYTAPVNLDENKVILRNRRHCKLTDNTCMDNDGSSAFWSSIPHNKCAFSDYDVLYEGPAQRIYDNTTETQDVQEVFSVQNGDITFGLARRGSEYICEHQLIRTEHPKLFILEIRKENMREIQTPIAVNNLDLMAYVNSKFIYVEKHFGKQLRDLYMDVLIQKCNLERQVIENSLLIAHSKPAEFALRVMKEKGYMAKPVGEVIHIIKCIPVPVTLARLSTCYSHLPVMVNNETMFMTPQTHILLKRSPKVDCNAYISPMYKVDNIWIKLTPEPIRAVAPEEMEPMAKPTWKYENLANLATSGIYSQSDLTKLQDHLMFAEEQTAILDTLARGSIGEFMDNPGVCFSHLIDENSIDKIAQRATDKLWGWLTGFGTFSAGLIGLFMIFKLVKFIVDTVLHGYALHKAFGWSIWLLGAIWDSLSNFLLHFKKRSTEGDSEGKKDDVESSVEFKATVPDEPKVTMMTATRIYPEIRTNTQDSFGFPRH